MNMLATETEEAAHQGNLRQLYTTTKKLSGKLGKPERPLNDKGGKPVPEEDGQKKRWTEHYEELLNRPAPQDLPDIPSANDHLPVDCDPPTEKEIHQDIYKQLKNGKSAGPDSSRAEALKTDIETSVELLRPLFKKIREEEQVLSEWKEGYLIKLLKKGDFSSCSSYRGITLLSIPGKVLR